MSKKEYLHRAKGITIRIVGLGGGGSSVVSEVGKNIDQASFYIADTDLDHLKKLNHKKITKFSFGAEETSGLGTGTKATEAQDIAQNEKDEISKVFSDADFSVLVACLGGGVGSGALPTFAQEARKADNLTLGVFTMPFSFEGPQKRKTAEEFLKKARRYLDAVVVIENERIFEIADSQMSFQEALSKINQHLITDLQGLIDIVRSAGTINIDFADLKAILQGRENNAYLSSVQAEGDKRVMMIKKNIVKNPLFKSSLKDVRRVLYNISAGVDMTISQVEEISQYIRRFNPRAQIIFGFYRKRAFKNKIKVDLLAMTSSSTNTKRKTKKSKKKKTKKSKKKKSSKKKKTKKSKKKTKKSKKKKSPQKKKNKKKKKEKKKKVEVSEDKEDNSKKRRNALEIKRKKSQHDGQFEETEKEKLWKKPAFLRNNKNN